MQAEYPKKVNSPYWDRVHVQPRVRKFPDTGESSETTGRRWRRPPEVVQELKAPVPEVRFYGRDYNVTSQLTRSQTREDFKYKAPETRRFNKHTACTENLYIYPPSRRLTDQPLMCNAHGTTEMRHAYKIPQHPPTLVTEKNQHKHPACLPDPPMIEPSWHKDLEPLETTYEGYEKYLDPYLTTSRLHHRPYTAEQLGRRSVTKDIVSYHTLSKEPWVRTRKPSADDWHLPLERCKIKYERESIRKNSTFSLPKEHVFREIITHNKPKWLPSSFRTEVRDNYVSPPSQAGSNIRDLEEQVQTYYKRNIANLETNAHYEHSTKEKFASETSQIGTGKPICSVLDQFKEKNKKLIMQSIMNSC
ncbi:uncharacterized protein LOC134747941 [Cydia strobilella]|uniref:uncharacterized protein LOC134747941 n=1 Tax=Cydia strobilella TaxID=1100964 RepID=UPI003004C6BB